MRSAETVLNIIRDRGQRGLPLEDVYRQLYNPDLYLRAYAKLYPNQGALTPGTTPETVDGMTRAKIDTIIETVRAERYRWTPVRRTYIPKVRFVLPKCDARCKDGRQEGDSFLPDNCIIDVGCNSPPL
jgi:hypothetical protein